MAGFYLNSLKADRLSLPREKFLGSKALRQWPMHYWLLLTAFYSEEREPRETEQNDLGNLSLEVGERLKVIPLKVQLLKRLESVKLP